VVGPTAQQTRSFDWLRDHLPPDGSVQLNDVTSMYTALDVIGPKAKELLSELTDTPLNKHDFMHMTCKVRVSRPLFEVFATILIAHRTSCNDSCVSRPTICIKPNGQSGDFYLMHLLVNVMIIMITKYIH